MDDETRKDIEGSMNEAYGASVWGGEDPSGPMISAMNAQTKALMAIEKSLINLATAIVVAQTRG